MGSIFKATVTGEQMAGTFWDMSGRREDALSARTSGITRACHVQCGRLPVLFHFNGSKSSSRSREFSDAMPETHLGMTATRCA